MICVDPLTDTEKTEKWKYGQKCHMFSDDGNLDGLHSFAEHILGLNITSFQNTKYPHYDLSKSRRRIAVKNGATEVGRRYIIIQTSRELTNVVGTCLSVVAIAAKYGIPEDEVEERLLDEGIETCIGCGWWFEVSELVDENDENPGYCDECRGEKQ